METGCVEGDFLSNPNMVNARATNPEQHASEHRHSERRLAGMTVKPARQRNISCSKSSRQLRPQGICYDTYSLKRKARKSTKGRKRYNRNWPHGCSNYYREPLETQSSTGR